MGGIGGSVEDRRYASRCTSLVCMPAAGSCDIYFSVDIESDGPIPGSFSMLSFALVAVATFDGEHFVRLDPHADSADTGSCSRSPSASIQKRCRSMGSIARGCSARAPHRERRCGRPMRGSASSPTGVARSSSPILPPSTGPSCTGTSRPFPDPRPLGMGLASTSAACTSARSARPMRSRPRVICPQSCSHGSAAYPQCLGRRG